MPGHYDKYPDGSWQQLHDQIQEAHDRENETKRKKAKKAGKILKDYKKKKSNQEPCVSCRGMGFVPTYTSKPIPPCKRCNGTGYVEKK